MEPVKTCATCRHSVVGRRDPMDWWKRRLCAHPGLVDRVEGRPMYEAAEARSKEGACGVVGALWEGAEPASYAGTWAELNVQDTERMERIFAGAVRPDPVDEAAAYDLRKPYGDSTWGRQMNEAVNRMSPPERLDGYGMPAPVDGVLFKVTNADEAFRHTEVRKTFTVAPGMLPRKPAKRARRKASTEGKE